MIPLIVMLGVMMMVIETSLTGARASVWQCRCTPIYFCQICQNIYFSILHPPLSGYCPRVPNYLAFFKSMYHFHSRGSRAGVLLRWETNPTMLDFFRTAWGIPENDVTQMGFPVYRHVFCKNCEDKPNLDI